MSSGALALRPGFAAELRPWFAWMAAAVAAAWVLSAIWWWLLTPNSNPDAYTEFVIPRGTAEATARGTGIGFLPATLSAPAGGFLRVTNADVVEHTIGNATIPPGAVADIRPGENGELSCTIHPSGFIGVRLRERPHLATTVVPAVLIGVPLGLLTAFATWLAKKLEAQGAA